MATANNQEWLQWFTCPNCGAKLSRPHPDTLDYVIEVSQCSKCGKLVDLRYGEPELYTPAVTLPAKALAKGVTI